MAEPIFKIKRGTKEIISKQPVEDGAIFVATEGDYVRVDSGENKLDIIPETWSISRGGTGGATAELARENLNVYDKATVDSTTTQAWDVSINATESLWTETDGKYTYSTSAIDGLICGKDGTIPPIITCISNATDYNKLESAIADSDTHIITFTASSLPSEEIVVKVIDVR